MTNGDIAPTLEVHDAVVRYGPILAVDRVSFALRRGEIVALLGDNGAGKSSLIKCISGAQGLDRGQIFVDGQEAAIRTPADAQRLGIETVYQDLALFDNLTVAENFFAGRELVRPQLRGIGFLRNKAMGEIALQRLAKLQVELPGYQTQVGLLSGGQRQAIAVARAVSFAARVVILDEPTAALGVRESRNVLELVRQLPRHGVAVILISHNLEHVMAVADRAIVLRRGRLIGEAAPTAANHDRLVSMIVGGANGSAQTKVKYDA